MLNSKYKALLRPRRSLLFMPGINERALEKAKDLPADVLIFDLEDAVQPESKVEARERVFEAVKNGSYGYREKVVRINSLASEWGEDDLQRFATSGADAILLPKVEHPDEVSRVISIIDSINPEREFPIWCMIETPLGVLNSAEIAATDFQVQAFVVGTSDLSYSLSCGTTPDRLPLLFSLSRTVLAARAHGLLAFDGVFLNLEDSDGFIRECEQGLQLGFDGKSLIHPKMLDTTNELFSPSPQQVHQAEKIIAAYEAAQAEQKAITVVDNKLVERLHFNHANNIVTLAKEIANRKALYNAA